MIRKRKLGKTGLEVSEVAFGCMITSDQSVIERAADLGVNLFDTARGYQGGNNERLVGAALKGRRDKVHISTKTGGGTKTEALAHLEESLRQLGTDHVDIWYLHGKSKAAELTDDLLDAQRVAKEQGKIRFAGVSLHSGHAEVIPAAIAKKMDVVLVTYNFTMADRNDALMQSLHDAGIGVVAMKVMAGGRGPEAVAMREKLASQGGMLAALKWTLRKPLRPRDDPEHDRHGAARREPARDGRAVVGGRRAEARQPASSRSVPTTARCAGSARGPARRACPSPTCCAT